MAYKCKECSGTYNFPKDLTMFQAQLHKRAYPKHQVVILIPANSGISVRRG
jgi:hypothetical protein